MIKFSADWARKVVDFCWQDILWLIDRFFAHFHDQNYFHQKLYTHVHNYHAFAENQYLTLSITTYIMLITPKTLFT